MGDARRFLTAVLHRRYGKTEMAVRWLVEKAKVCEHPKPQCFYLGATLKSVEVVAWDMLKAACPPKTRFNSGKLTATLPGGAKVTLIGAWNWQTHRGVYADALVIDEVDLIPPSAFDSVFRPALSDRLGSALFIGTPLGKGHLYQRYKAAERAPSWASWRVPVTQTDVLDPDEVIELEATMPRSDWLREYMVDFDAAAPGAYYADQIEAAFIGETEVRHDLPVTACWNLSASDSLVVTLWQEHHEKLHCIDAIWEQQTSFGDMAKILADKPYPIALHRSSGNEQHKPGGRVAIARREGIPLKPVNNLTHIERVYGTKPIIPRATFNAERCSDVVEGLRMYRADYDEVKRVYNPYPIMDWSQEFAGSVETYAASHNPRRTDWSKPILYPDDAIQRRGRRAA